MNGLQEFDVPALPREERIRLLGARSILPWGVLILGLSTLIESNYAAFGYLNRPTLGSLHETGVWMFFFVCVPLSVVALFFLPMIYQRTPRSIMVEPRGVRVRLSGGAQRVLQWGSPKFRRVSLSDFRAGPHWTGKAPITLREFGYPPHRTPLTPECALAVVRSARAAGLCVEVRRRTTAGPGGRAWTYNHWRITPAQGPSRSPIDGVVVDDSDELLLGTKPPRKYVTPPGF